MTWSGKYMNYSFSCVICILQEPFSIKRWRRLEKYIAALSIMCYLSLGLAVRVNDMLKSATFDKYHASEVTLGSFHEALCIRPTSTTFGMIPDVLLTSEVTISVNGGRVLQAKTFQGSEGSILSLVVCPYITVEGVIEHAAPPRGSCRHKAALFQIIALLSV